MSWFEQLWMMLMLALAMTRDWTFANLGLVLTLAGTVVAAIGIWLYVRRQLSADTPAPEVKA